MRYRSKPCEVEAQQWSGSNWHSMLAWVRDEHSQDIFTEPDADGPALFLTDLRVVPGEWLIFSRGVWSVLPADAFARCYDEIPDE